MRRPLLTVCVITRDEEDTLERCLVSVKDVADRLVVVDTGSTDGTEQIATRLGASVFRRLWDDDFSAARNHAIEQARTPWILMVDADELVTDVDTHDLRARLTAAAGDGGDHAFAIRIDNETDTGSVAPFFAVRLFRNHRRIRYRGRIHEEVTSSLAEWRGAPVSPPVAPLVLRHDGYLSRRRLGGGKRERNLRLLTRAVERDSRQALVRFALARELLLVCGERIFPGENFGRALTALQQAHDRVGREEVPPHLVSAIDTTLAAALVADARPAMAIDLLRGSPVGRRVGRHDVPAACARRDFVLARAMLAAAGEDRAALEAAAECFAALIGGHITPGFVDVDARVCSVFAMEREAEALGRMGRVGEAFRRLDAAEAQAGAYAGPQVRRAELHLLGGQTRDGFAAYQAALETDAHDPEAWLGVARVLRFLGESEAEVNALDNALNLVPLWTDAILQKSILRFLQDRPDDVMSDWSVHREISVAADVVCLVAEVLAGRPVTGLCGWRKDAISRSLLCITAGLAAGKRSDLLERLKAPAGPSSAAARA
ncbi:MAG: glycosyltransferase [Acidobacteriota bacterium]